MSLPEGLLLLKNDDKFDELRRMSLDNVQAVVRHAYNRLQDDKKRTVPMSPAEMATLADDMRRATEVLIRESQVRSAEYERAHMEMHRKGHQPRVPDAPDKNN